ncbi:MAG: chromosome segregation protein SMC [Ignavibacteriaceae bacterium]|nr:chromosome segregation protein SMC [Ignavibacteriaceae bacterium]
MYLSRLEIFGFKSFANKTVINFTKGITGIVGPNGCGKTNIVDAIRWSLGEQKTSTLRSDKMENVIFNGTATKKPMGMSEVSLTLVNDAGLLPTEYSEVTITRRIFRSGESEYLLNKNICRLKDITNLFMDTGMGTNAYSIIELKMIEPIVSGKADDVRKMFEEAAGVNKYKVRRKLSLKKLDDVKLDLTRVNDIVAEVEKNVRSLERQAKRADQHNQIQSILKEKEIDLSEREFTLNTRKKNEIESQISEFSVLRQEIDNHISDSETVLLNLRNDVMKVESQLSQKRLEINKNTDELHNVQKTVSVNEEKLKSLNNTIIRLKNECTDFEKQIERNNELIEENYEFLAEIDSNISKNNIDSDNSQLSLEEKKRNLDSKKLVTKELNDQFVTIERNLRDAQNQLKNSESEFDKIKTTIEKFNQRILTTTNTIAKTVGYIEELNNEKSVTVKKFEETETFYFKKKNEKESLDKELSKLKNQEVEERTAIAALREKINIFQNLITNLEGVSEGSKILIESSNWTPKHKLIFADVGNATDEFRYALEAALKNVLNNLLVDSLEDVKSAINFLKNNELGKASFFLLNKNGGNKPSLIDRLYKFSIGRKAAKIKKEKGFINWASELVNSEIEWQPYFLKVLSQTIIADTLENAIEIHQKYPEFDVASLEGDIVKANGIIEAGSLPKLDDTLFGRKQLLENLISEYPLLEDKLNILKSNIASVEEKIASIDLNDINESSKVLLNDINNTEKQISQFEFEKKKANEEVENTQKQIQELASRSNDLDNEKIRLSSLIENVTQERTTKLSEISELESNLKLIEEDYNSFYSEINSRKIELEKLKGQSSNLSSTILRTKESIKQLRDGIDKRQENIEETEEEIDELKGITYQLNESLTKINEIRHTLFNQQTEIELRLRNLKEESTEKEKALREIRNKRQEISDKIHNLQIKQNELSLRLENLIHNIMVTYSLELQVKEYEDLETFNYKERNEEVNTLKEKLRNIGPVNLLSFSEYEEERTRMEFFHKQRNDLIDSEKDLINTINEINQTAQQLFIETFEQIRTNFKTIFQTLFNEGDESDIILEEGVDPLESKIEIMAKPKGKRPTNIEQLSGGERTLSAIALLFAIYLVKPSPFCILDEVDAPLDDANIDKFSKLLIEFTNRTQFILITHNKRTMEASENMYGVTMQETGISKLAAVQFNDEIELN